MSQTFYKIKLFFLSDDLKHSKPLSHNAVNERVSELRVLDSDTFPVCLRPHRGGGCLFKWCCFRGAPLGNASVSFVGL